MRDRECVNRFCAFTLFGVSGYQSGDMDAFLARTLQEMNSSNGILQHLSIDFRRSMVNNYSVFGPHSFRKHRRSSTRRSVINIALFDVFSVLLSRVPEEVVEDRMEAIHEAFFRLMDNDEFVDAITISTNSTSKVQTRFGIADMILGPLVNDYQH